MLTKDDEGGRGVCVYINIIECEAGIRDLILRDSQKKLKMSLLACQRKKLKGCWVELEDLGTHGDAAD